MEHQPDDKGLHQNIARATAVISALADAASAGLRLTDVAQATGLGKATARRTLAGLVAHGWVDHDEDSGRFFLGLRILSWSAAAADRFGLAKLAEPSLTRLAESTQDTAYLTMLSGGVAVCALRREGAFPIKVLTLSVGDRRPLGIGAGSLALLAALPEPDVGRVLREQAEIRASYPFDEIRLRQMIADTLRQGYAFNDVHVYPGMEAIHGMSAVALPVRRADGMPVCALSVAALTERMAPPRRDTIVETIRGEVERIEAELQAALSNPVTAELVLAKGD